MEDEPNDAEFTRPPVIADLVEVCDYVVIGVCDEITVVGSGRDRSCGRINT